MYNQSVHFRVERHCLWHPALRKSVSRTYVLKKAHGHVATTHVAALSEISPATLPNQHAKICWDKYPSIQVSQQSTADMPGYEDLVLKNVPAAYIDMGTCTIETEHELLMPRKETVVRIPATELDAVAVSAAAGNIVWLSTGGLTTGVEFGTEGRLPLTMYDGWIPMKPELLTPEGAPPRRVARPLDAEEPLVRLDDDKQFAIMDKCLSHMVHDVPFEPLKSLETSVDLGTTSSQSSEESPIREPPRKKAKKSHTFKETSLDEAPNFVREMSQEARNLMLSLSRRSSVQSEEDISLSSTQAIAGSSTSNEEDSASSRDLKRKRDTDDASVDLTPAESAVPEDPSLSEEIPNDAEEEKSQDKDKETGTWKSPKEGDSTWTETPVPEKKETEDERIELQMEDGTTGWVPTSVLRKLMAEYPPQKPN